MHFENPQELPINDSLQDDMLYGINRSDPWYADIVNFMVSGYVPPGGDKKNLSRKAVFTYGMNRTFFESVQMACSRDVYPQKRESRLSKDVTHHHMEGIMGHSSLMQKFGRVDFFGQPCMKKRKTSFEDVVHAKDMVISIQETPYHLPTIFKLSFLMSRVLITWDHFQNQRAMNTSWW